ncbi:sirohydrochlorin cobaltochelatase [Acetonema longum]|uniref:Sirohydrochlorin cobaltochelatase n=1 Tax=Acetonema longum DSM 6540 TaxID=1009370 RepID=F7NN16_9FIRM|nr:sirohydrochlorin cobaltochelatase [Acetonema longum]EGO62550.1 Sirohydrochlorin cobaltochelatase [Acetonema longum DSM 6540]
MTQTPGPSDKKAILVVSFGTTYADARQACIESVEERMRAAFPGYEVRRAFTSRMIIRRLAERDGVLVDNEQQALERLLAEGFSEVYVQPLHIVAGDEYEKISRIVSDYVHAEKFSRLELGRPLLYYMGQGNHPDDYLAAIEALDVMPGPDEAVVFMGHGGLHPANAAYAAMELKLQDAGKHNVFLYAVEGYPSLQRIIGQLRDRSVREVKLQPFMLVAGNHVRKDMDGEEKETAKSMLTAAGFAVELKLNGLGENPAIQDIYVQHVRDIIDSQPEKTITDKT